MTPEQLAAIKARAEAATPGPWQRRELRHGSGTCYVLADIGSVDNYLIADCTAIKNTEFIAHARQDIPELVAEVERLREALRQIADSTKWGEDTAIKREITRIQSDAAHALRVREVTE